MSAFGISRLGFHRPGLGSEADFVANLRSMRARVVSYRSLRVKRSMEWRQPDGERTREMCQLQERR